MRGGVRTEARASAPTPKCGQGTDIFKPAGNMGGDQERQDCTRRAEGTGAEDCGRACVTERERGRERDNECKGRRVVDRERS